MVGGYLSRIKLTVSAKHNYPPHAIYIEIFVTVKYLPRIADAGPYEIENISIYLWTVCGMYIFAVRNLSKEIIPFSPIILKSFFQTSCIILLCFHEILILSEYLRHFAKYKDILNPFSYFKVFFDISKVSLVITHVFSLYCDIYLSIVSLLFK